MINIKPGHVGIIMDGNRRFAKSLNLSPWKGHEYGEKKVFELLEWCKDLNIKEVTVYAFSVQNINRPKLEFDYLMNIFLKCSENLLNDSKFLNSGVRIRVLGDLSLFPEDVRLRIDELVEKTKNNDSYFFNVALGYGGREEILRAVKRIANDVLTKNLSVEDIDESVFEDNLYLSSCPDLIIRTGGERRTSNFLPWQSTYSEWVFLDKKWPEFSKEDLVKCINDFSKRDRRFGK
ncbi:di-trans,poly-cis-decaprenylcistransferase [Candidatus Woesearchaeota archaeon]|nr:di-trans,poly-cis-decaprenylcistransferase [Candidatus Woesearchaeota archaeon]